MSLFKFITLIFNLRIWFAEKWDSMFPIKKTIGINKNSKEYISFTNNNKIYEKILVKYEIKSKIYKIIYNDTNLNTIKKIPLKDIPFHAGLHKPIISIKIKYNRNEKRHVISHIIPKLKEFKQTTNFIDFLIFNLDKIPNEDKTLFYKIYIQTFNKVFCFKYNQIQNIQIIQFYKLLV